MLEDSDDTRVDTLNWFDGDGSSIEINVVGTPGRDPEYIEAVYAIRDFYFERSASELAKAIKAELGTQPFVLTVHGTEYSWGASNAAIEIIVMISSGVVATAIWDLLKSLPAASDSWELPELDRTEALGVARSEIGRAFNIDPSTLPDPIREVRDSKHDWRFEIKAVDRLFRAEVAAAHTGTRAKIEVERLPSG